jgi:polar amino acid transport system permease protein
MKFDFALMAGFATEIARAAGITFALWITSSVLSCAGGLLIAIVRRFVSKNVDLVFWVPINVVRGVPFLIQVFLLYYGGPFIGLTLDNMTAGILALTVFGSAIFAEIWRAGFDAVPKGHLEAAQCVGLTRAQTVRRIMLPEMFLIILPPAINAVILLLKETAILSIISVPELTFEVSSIGTEYYAFVESFTVLALFYWAMVEACASAGRYLEMRCSHLRLV